MEGKVLPSEIIILMAIVVNNKTSKKLLSRPMDITGEYVGYLFDSLINRGYLKQSNFRAYQLTPTGHNAIVTFIRKNKTKSKDVIKRLQLLGIDISPEQEKVIYKMGMASV
jgi:predicted transcriptional regulator